jgi:hypothetical protein
METRFLEAWINREHTVYGYKLRPYSLGISIQLEAVDSPLITGRPPLPIHLLAAAQICAGQQPKPSLARLAFHSYRSELAKWDAYIRDYSTGPSLYEEGGGSAGSRLNAPWQLSLVTKLITKTTISEPEAWAMPMGKVFWHVASINEQETGTSYIFPEDLERELEAAING